MHNFPHGLKHSRKYQHISEPDDAGRQGLRTVPYAIQQILGGLFPPLSYFIRTVPTSVIGGVLLVVIGQIVVAVIFVMALFLNLVLPKNME